MIRTYAVIAFVAAVVLGVYFNVPGRFFTDGVFPLAELDKVIAYDDEVDGGLSKTTFKNSQDALDFSCSLGEDDSKSAWCGLLIDMIREDSVQTGLLLYRDWTFVDSVIVDLEAHGTDEILLKIWTFDPEVTDVKVPRSFRLLMKELPLTEGRQRISIPLEQFYTPEFWYKDGKVDTTLVLRHQESVARVEIAPGWNHPRGKKFSLKIYEIYGKGLSNTAFGVVMFIMLGLTIVAIGRRHSLHKNSDGK